MVYTWFMLKNRSVPVDIILPHITYQNVTDAVAFPTDHLVRTRATKGGAEGNLAHPHGV